MTTLTMKLTQDVAEIINTYKVSVSARNYFRPSCLTGSKAVKVFAYDTNLHLAKFYDVDNNFVGRCLVRTDRMEHTRTYAIANNYHTEMYRTLELQGFNAGTLENIRLAKIRARKISSRKGWYVMPYLDGCCNLVDCGSYFKIVGDETSIVVNTTSGKIFIGV